MKPGMDMRKKSAVPPVTGEGVSRQAVERITVALINKASKDLAQLQERTGLSKTDIVNRAISVYEFISREMDSGNEVLIRDQASSETQVLRLL